MKKLKKYFKKILNYNFKKTVKTNRNKMFFSNYKKNTFKKRKKQLSLNINNFNHITHILKNKYFWYLGLLSIFIIGIIILLFSPYTKIKKINIIKKDDITNIDIAYNSIDSFRGKSILTIDKNKIKKNLIKYQSNIKNIKIDLLFPNSIKISIESYKPIFYTKINNLDKKYLILSNGTLIPYSKDEIKLKQLNIKTNDDSKLPNFLDYKNIYSEIYINNINNIINKLKENIIDINIEELNYYTIERELHIKTKHSLLIFSLEEHFDEQIKKLVIFNKDHKNITKIGINYIDLRIKDKIFYCPSEEKRNCNKNLKNIYNIKEIVIK